MIFNARSSTNFKQPQRANDRPTTSNPTACLNDGGKRHVGQLCPAKQYYMLFMRKNWSFSISLFVCSPLRANVIESHNKIHVKVFNQNVVALPDTGASRGCISQTVADQFKLKILPIENDDKFLTLQTANGNNLQIAGQVEISIKISRFHIPHTFIVLPELHQNLILGCVFFAMTHAAIELSKNVVTFYDELLTEPIKIHRRVQNFLVTTNYTVLPPLYGTITLVKTHQTIRTKIVLRWLNDYIMQPSLNFGSRVNSLHYTPHTHSVVSITAITILIYTYCNQ